MYRRVVHALDMSSTKRRIRISRRAATALATMSVVAAVVGAVPNMATAAGDNSRPTRHTVTQTQNTGIAAQTILLAFQLAHANRRKIRKWLHTLALGGERPRRRTHHRRPTREPKTWTPTGHLTPAA